MSAERGQMPSHNRRDEKISEGGMGWPGSGFMSEAAVPRQPVGEEPKLSVVRKPKPWIAILLSLFLIPGSGHLYNGEFRTGVGALMGSVVLRLVEVLIAAATFAQLIVIFCASLLWRLSVTVHAGIRAQRLDAVSSRWFNRWYVYPLIAFLFGFGFGVFKPYQRFRAYRIPSVAMAPTLLNGDYLFVDTWWHHRHTPRHGDVVVFKSPTDGRDFIKRCVAVAGDTVEMRGKVLYVNGKKRKEPYAQHTDRGTLSASQAPRDWMGPVVIPPGHIFMLGDNRDNSHDSRFWGPLPIERVTGKGLYLYFSVDMGRGEGLPRVRWERIGRAVATTSLTNQ